VKDQLEALILQMYKSNILYSEGVREFKKRFILTVLQENKGNQCRAARELGMHRNTLSRTLSELKISKGSLRRLPLNKRVYWNYRVDPSVSWPLACGVREASAQP
jgi:Fis family transcriptional regulator, factor for inversion stimulation protein